MKPIIKVLLIVFIAEGGVMLLAGIVMLGISLAYDVVPAIGVLLSLAGLVQLLVGIWLFKRGGKGILTRGTGTADK